MQQLSKKVSGNAASAEQFIKSHTDQDEDQVMAGSGDASRREADEGRQLLSQQHCQSRSSFVALKDHAVPS